MKYLLIVFSAMFLLSFSAIEYNINKSTAEVIQINGLYIFMDCTPVSEYQTLGSVKSPAIVSDYEAYRDALSSKVKKKYPNANGIILHLVSGDVGTGEAILIK